MSGALVRRVAIAVLAALVLGHPGYAGELLPAQKALLTLRVLAYDRNLPARAKGLVRVAVVYRSEHAASERERDDLLLALEEVSQRAVVAGLPVRARPLAYDSTPAFRTRLEEAAPVAILVCAGLDPAVPELARLARQVSALTVGGTREQVLRGLAVALVDRGERASLVVNPRAAAEQGADLDSALLSLADRVEP